MPLTAKSIRTRIRSIKNTNKITKAMELISANKMHKASKRAEGSRFYDREISEVLESIIKSGQTENRFFRPSDSKNQETSSKIAVVLFSGNRGLCGSFNSEICSFARKSILQKVADKNRVDWIAIGKKGAESLSRGGESLQVEFKKQESMEEAEEFFSIAKYITKEFLDGRWSEIWIAYTDFVSSFKHIPKLKKLLPLSLEEEQTLESKELVFEPGKEKLLSFLVPRYIEAKMYQALLESNASEHSARMMAMKNASDACKEITDELLFYGNELRQGSITREIIEIAGAKAAMSAEEDF